MKLEVRPGSRGDWVIWAVLDDGSARVLETVAGGGRARTEVAWEAEAIARGLWRGGHAHDPELLISGYARTFLGEEEHDESWPSSNMLVFGLVVGLPSVFAWWLWAPSTWAVVGWVIVGLSVTFGVAAARDDHKNGYPARDVLSDGTGMAMGVGWLLAGMWLVGWLAWWALGSVILSSPSDAEVAELRPATEVTERVSTEVCREADGSDAVLEDRQVEECAEAFAAAVEEVVYAAAQYDVVRPGEDEGICVSEACLVDRWPSGDYAPDAHRGYRMGVQWASDYIDDVTPG